MKIQKIYFFATLLLIFIFSSCSTPLKEVTYLNNIETGKTYENGPLPKEYLIQTNDQLFIQVISDNPANAAFLNLISGTSTSMGSNTNSMEIITYLVDQKGMISYPQLGDIKVSSKTVSEVRDNIQSKVDNYLKGASVYVKLVNRTVTVLGEVRQPGQKLMVKNQLTIFEALGAAGDITDYGNRRNVKIIRELPEGKHIESLDLTDPNIISSPYYYVLPQDIVYVEMSTKVYGAKNLSYAAPLSIATSLISVGLLIVNLFK